MSKRMYHPCHKLSVPSAKIFWCRHCMQMFEDAISRWKHSKTCRDGAKYKDTDGQVIQMYVKPDKVSYTANVTPGHIIHKPHVKKTSADLKCVICQTKFFSLHDMREHVKFPCQRQYAGYPSESDDSDADTSPASSLKIRRVEASDSNSTALSVLAEASKHVESLCDRGLVATSVELDLYKSQQPISVLPTGVIAEYPQCYSLEEIGQQQKQEIVVEAPRPKSRVDLEPVVIVIQAEDGQDIPEALWDIDTIQKCVKETVSTLPLGQIIQLQINVHDKIVKHYTVGFKGAIYPIDEVDLPQTQPANAGELANTSADIESYRRVRDEQVVRTSVDSHLSVLADILSQKGQVKLEERDISEVNNTSDLSSGIWSKSYTAINNTSSVAENTDKAVANSYQVQGTVTSQLNPTGQIQIQNPGTLLYQEEQRPVHRIHPVPDYQTVVQSVQPSQIAVQPGEVLVETSSCASQAPLLPDPQYPSSSVSFNSGGQQRFQIADLVSAVQGRYQVQAQGVENQLQPSLTLVGQQTPNQFAASIETQTPQNISHATESQLQNPELDHSYQENFLNFIHKNLTKAELNQEALNSLQSIIEAQEAAETLTNSVHKEIESEPSEVIEISQVADSILSVVPQSETVETVEVQTAAACDTRAFIGGEESQQFETKLVIGGEESQQFETKLVIGGQKDLQSIGTGALIIGEENNHSNLVEEGKQQIAVQTGIDYHKESQVEQSVDNDLIVIPNRVSIPSTTSSSSNNIQYRLSPNVQIDHTLHDLRCVLETDGAHQKSLQDHINGDHFKGHLISRCPEIEITSVKTKFVNALIENIEKRFPDTDLLSSFGILSMRPVSLLSSEDLAKWGNEQLEVLLNHFGTEKTHTWKMDKEEKSQTAPPLVDAAAARSEWDELKIVVKVQMYPRDSIFTLWKLISDFHKEMFPNMIKLAYLAMTCPINTAGCERGFSVQNQTLTPSRNRLSPETQDLLFRLRINGLPSEQFPFESALHSWKSNSNRKMFS